MDCCIQENTPEAEKVALVRENIYVRVHGHVRAFAGKRNVAAFRVVPLTDMNELTSHLLEVIYAHAHWTKGQAMVRVYLKLMLLLTKK